MKIDELLTSQEKEVLSKALDAALDMQDILKTLTNGGLPYNQHMEKANEQVSYLEKIMTMFNVERNK